MIFVKFLSPEEIQTLEDMQQHHSCHAPRIRAHAILLSYDMVTLSMNVRVYNVCRQTWFKTVLN
jgi:hypothetical protein